MGKQKETSNHHMGKHTGYELVDGVYHIAPLYTERFNGISARRKGIEDMLAAVTRESSKGLEVLALEDNKVWADVVDDLGLGKDTTWSFINGTIQKMNK